MVQCTCVFGSKFFSELLVYIEYIEPYTSVSLLPSSRPSSLSYTPPSVAIDALKQFLKVTGSDQMLERLETNSVWPLMEKEDTCPHAMLHLARYAYIHVRLCMDVTNTVAL